MPDMPYSEASELLAEYKYCDAGAWEPHPKEPHALMHNLPVIAADGSYMKGVRCEVFYKESSETGTSHWVFTLTKQEKERRKQVYYRAYQLDIFIAPFLTPNDHRRPHVHIGDQRLPLENPPQSWSFVTALEKFSIDCNIHSDIKIEAPKPVELLL